MHCFYTFITFSSRFTDSSKYEDQFQSCFKLAEARVGEICNACVLLVKRWKKLPKNTKRNWAHVVDARAGPGTKSFVKQKKKDETPEEFEKIRRKHVYHKKPRLDDDEIAPQSTMSVTSNSVDIGGGEIFVSYLYPYPKLLFIFYNYS